MKLLLDARKWEDGGIGVMIQMLATHLTKHGIQVRCISKPKNQSEITEITGLHPIISEVKPYTIQELFVISHLANHTDADVVSIPHYTVPFFCKKPIVSIIHDTIQMMFPEQFSILQRSYAKWMIDWALKRSDVITTQSVTVKEDLVRTFPNCDETKIQPILRIPDSNWYNEPLGVNEIQLPEVYCLYFGAYRKHKNLSFLIRIWEEHLDLPPLIIAGDRLEQYRHLKADLNALLHNQRITDYGVLNFSTLKYLVKNATCVLLPSLYEGYGSTPIEAMMVGVPSIVSNRGALPESCGTGAEVLSLDSTTKWYESICKFRDKTHRENQIHAGKAWLQTFDENDWIDNHIIAFQKAIQHFQKRA